VAEDDPPNTPFIRGADRWCVTPTGDFGRDCDLGHSFARRYLELCNIYRKERRDFAPVFKSMIEKGQWSGVEVGFVFAIEEFIRLSINDVSLRAFYDEMRRDEDDVLDAMMADAERAARDQMAAE